MEHIKFPCNLTKSFLTTRDDVGAKNMLKRHIVDVSFENWGICLGNNLYHCIYYDEKVLDNVETYLSKLYISLTYKILEILDKQYIETLFC